MRQTALTPRPRLRILFDHNTPDPLRHYLREHYVDTAEEQGWAGLANGALIRQAEENGYDVLITADQNLRHQQNLSNANIGIVVLLSNRWPLVREHTMEITDAIRKVQPGQLLEVPISPRR